MYRAALKGILARKRRFAFTAMAIVLGVTFATGTFVLTDTMKASFDRAFAQLAVGSDLVVRSRPLLGEESAVRKRLPASTVEAIRKVPGVADAAGVVYASGKLVTADNRAVIRSGLLSAIGTSWSEGIGPLRIVDGRAPMRAGEIALDAGSVRRLGFNLGGTVNLAIRSRPERFRVVGTVAIGANSDLRSATYFALDTASAQQHFGANGSFDWFYVRAERGVTAERLKAELERRLPMLRVESSATFARALAEPTRVALGYFSYALLSFAVIGVFVGLFIIFNTFSILMQQRTRELAMFRALGASGRQVIRSVLIEAFVVGVVASAIGIALGIGLASLLLTLIPHLGFPIPDGGIVLLGRTVIAGAAVGVLGTVLAALAPAIHAARTPPLVAMSEAPPMSSAPLRRRGLAGVAASGLGLAAMAWGLWGNADDVAIQGMTVGAGAMTVFIGAVVIGPVVARPLVRVLSMPSLGLFLSASGVVVGAISSGLGVSRLVGGEPAKGAGTLALAAGCFLLAFLGPTAFGILGRLAQANAMRNPRRTSATAFALVVGFTLVCVVATFASSARSSLRTGLANGLRADLVIASDQLDAFPGEVATIAANVPDVVSVSGLRMSTNSRLGDDRAVLAGVQPESIDDVVNLDYRSGSAAGLGADGILVHADQARKQRLKVGDRVGVVLPRASVVELTVGGVYTNQRFAGALAIDAIVSQTRFDVHSGDEMDTFVFVKAAPGQANEARVGLSRALSDYEAIVDVQTASAYGRQQQARIADFVNVVVALLAFSLLIAGIGIVNTLCLSVSERRRELGLLRAAGMTRVQVRRMVRSESVVVAMLGCILGLGMGLLWAWSFNHVLRGQGLSSFSVPVTQLALFVVFGAVAGVVAALFPAWRAGRLDVLIALAYE